MTSDHSSKVEVKSHWSYSATALCPPSLAAIGGGFAVGGDPRRLVVQESYPFSTNDSTGWSVRIVNVSDTQAEADVSVWVACTGAKVTSIKGP